LKSSPNNIMETRLRSTSRIVNITHMDNRRSIDSSLVGYRRKRAIKNEVFALGDVNEAAIVG